jgi:hypothetical protein
MVKHGPTQHALYIAVNLLVFCDKFAMQLIAICNATYKQLSKGATDWQSENHKYIKFQLVDHIGLDYAKEDLNLVLQFINERI